MLERVEEGYTDKAIADEFGLKRKTVSNRLSGSTGIFYKLNVPNRKEAGRWLSHEYVRQFPLEVEPQKTKGIINRFELWDHLGLWCALCLEYLKPHEIGAYHPYGKAPLVDNLELQVALGKALDRTVPVHRDGCPSMGVVLNVSGVCDHLNSLLLCSTPVLEDLAKTTFYRGDLIRNMVIRLILSCRSFELEDEEKQALELVKGAISNAGSSQSEVIGPILNSQMPWAFLKNSDYHLFRFLLALGNRSRNIGRPDFAEREYYGRARYILSKMNPKPKKYEHALERRELSISLKCASAKEEKRIDRDAEEDAQRYGVLTTKNYIGLNNFRKNEYIHAEGIFREMEMLFDAKNQKATSSWWHKMSGWFGLGITLYINEKRGYEDALRYCLKAEYVSAMLGLQVDVARDVNEQLLRPNVLLCPSAIVRKIGKEKKIAKRKMEEIRHTALIEGGLQKDLLEELSGVSLGLII
jgi:hypothetical protein